MLQPVFVIVNMAQYVENFNLQIPHDHICRWNLEIQSLVLKLDFRTGGSSPYNLLFVRLVSSKSKQICKKWLVKEGKRTNYRDVNGNKTR